ncbi:hypothetical protein AAE478_001691 [Parahypoxylon ruwenzoriense]
MQRKKKAPNYRAFSLSHQSTPPDQRQHKYPDRIALYPYSGLPGLTGSRSSDVALTDSPCFPAQAWCLGQISASSRADCIVSTAMRNVATEVLEVIEYLGLPYPVCLTAQSALRDGDSLAAPVRAAGRAADIDNVTLVTDTAIVMEGKGRP